MVTSTFQDKLLGCAGHVDATESQCIVGDTDPHRGSCQAVSVTESRQFKPRFVKISPLALSHCSVKEDIPRPDKIGGGRGGGC